LTESTFTIDVGPLTFSARGDGPQDGEPVLLLHGFPQTSLAWRPQIAALAGAGYRAVAFDQRGYSPGARPAEVEAYRSPELYGDVVGVADALGFDRFHLVGHDWGGAVAWQVGGRHGDRLRTLTVVSTPHPAAMGQALSGSLGGDQPSRSSYFEVFRTPGSENSFLADDAQFFHLLFAGSGMPEGGGDPYVEALGTPEALGAALNWYRAADLSLVEGLGPIEVPTMYVWSTEDPALGREAAEATGRFVEGPYRFEVLEGVSHWVSDQAPDRLNALLLDHLRAGAEQDRDSGGRLP
jgi:pimeloyl-ACP methyl ester carboxylesterase